MARSTKSTTKAAPAPAQPAPQAEETITVVGRLVAAPVLRQTKSGKAVANLRLAVAEKGQVRFISV